MTSVPEDNAPRGDPDALRARFAELYAELRRVAQFLVKHERPSATLSATELVHDAYVRLEKMGGASHAPVEQLVPLAARTMRRMLIDRSRRQRAWRGRRKATPIDDDIPGADPRFARAEELEAFDSAMMRLTRAHPRQAAAYEFCVGWEVAAETASLEFGCSRRTVELDVAFARAFLRRELAHGREAHERTR